MSVFLWAFFSVFIVIDIYLILKVRRERREKRAKELAEAMLRNFRIEMLDSVTGDFRWQLTETYSAKFAECRNEDDQKFVEHHLRGFLLLMLAVMTTKDPKKKILHKKEFHAALTALTERIQSHYKMDSGGEDANLTKN